jgi:hypothetical protein
MTISGTNAPSPDSVKDQTLGDLPTLTGGPYHLRGHQIEGSQGLPSRFDSVGGTVLLRGLLVVAVRAGLAVVRGDGGPAGEQAQRVV